MISICGSKETDQWKYFFHSKTMKDNLPNGRLVEFHEIGKFIQLDSTRLWYEYLLHSYL